MVIVSNWIAEVLQNVGAGVTSCHQTPEHIKWSQNHDCWRRWIFGRACLYWVGLPSSLHPRSFSHFCILNLPSSSPCCLSAWLSLPLTALLQLCLPPGVPFTLSCMEKLSYTLSSNSNVTSSVIFFFLTLLPKHKQKQFLWSFIWPTADVIGIVCNSPWGDWNVQRLDCFLLIL